MNKTWGPHFWFVLHKSASAFPQYPTELDKYYATCVIKALPLLLPAESSNNTRKFITEVYPNIRHAVSSKREYVEFFWRLHNYINRIKGAAQLSLSTVYAYDSWMSRTTEWGPYFWYFLHIGATNYPKIPYTSQMEAMEKFVRAFHVMLPCKTCSDHAKSYVDHNSEEVNSAVFSRGNLIEFFIRFHNWVNNRLHKPQICVEQAKNAYLNF